jgi:uncharacterized membrane protein YfcA
MNSETAISEGADATPAGRSAKFAKIALTLGVIALVVHFLPIGANPKTQVAALALVVMSGLSFLTWIPKQRFDLSFSVVLAGGLALPVLVSSALLIADWYTPDWAALVTGLLALISLFMAAQKESRR